MPFLLAHGISPLWAETLHQKVHHHKRQQITHSQNSKEQRRAFTGPSRLNRLLLVFTRRYVDPTNSSSPPTAPLTSVRQTNHQSSIKMKHLAAYLLLQLGGNASPSASDIETVLSSVGIEVDSDRVSSLLKELEGKDINEVRNVMWNSVF